MIKITLSSAAMGDVTEADFDAWAAYVSEHIDDALGTCVDVEVDQFAFGETGEDRISGATDEQREAIRSWLSAAGWEAFCADPAAWPVAAE